MSGRVGDGRFRRLSAGLRRLDHWAASAGQVDKNAMYKALFAVADGSVFRAYTTWDDDATPVREFFVLVREDLVVKISFRRTDSFGIVYIGSLTGAPGVGIGLEA